MIIVIIIIIIIFIFISHWEYTGTRKWE